MRNKLRDRLHRARLDRRKNSPNPLAAGDDPDAPDWFEPAPEINGATFEAALSSGSVGYERSKERDVVHTDDLSFDEEARGTSTADAEQEEVEAGDEGFDTFDGDPGISGPVPGFSDWREELRERLKRIRARREQEQLAAESAAAEGVAAPGIDEIDAEEGDGDVADPVAVEEPAEEAPGLAAAADAPDLAIADAPDLAIADAPDFAADDSGAESPADVTAESPTTPARGETTIDAPVGDLTEPGEPLESLALASGAAAGEEGATDGAEDDAATTGSDLLDRLVSDRDGTRASGRKLGWSGHEKLPLDDADEMTQKIDFDFDDLGEDADTDASLDAPPEDGEATEDTRGKELAAVVEETAETVAAEAPADAAGEAAPEDAPVDVPDIAAALDDLEVVDAMETEAATADDEADGGAREAASSVTDDDLAGESPAADEPLADGKDDARSDVQDEEDTAHEDDLVAVEPFDGELDFEPAGGTAAGAIDVAAEATQSGEAFVWDLDEAEDLQPESAIASSAGPLGERAAAATCDALVLTGIGAALVGAASSGTGLPFRQIIAEQGLWLALTWSIFAVGYSVFFVGSCGQTIGRMIMRLRVVGSGHFKVGFDHAAIRLAAWLVSLLPLGAGMLPALKDPQRRALHDRLSQTRVVKA